jgi:hypothetical protein
LALLQPQLQKQESHLQVALNLYSTSILDQRPSGRPRRIGDIQTDRGNLHVDGSLM